MRIALNLVIPLLPVKRLQRCCYPVSKECRVHLQQPRTRMLNIWVLALALSACSGPEEQVVIAEPATKQGVPVRLASVQLRTDNELFRFSSISRVRQRAFLTFQVGGVIQGRSVELGDQVVAGQTLMTLYSPSLQPAADAAQFRLQQLESDKAQADRELERLKTLYERGVIPQQELEQQATRSEALVSAVNNARATAQQAQSLLREAALLAPFSGTVEQILLEPGEFAQPGQSVMRISASTQLEAEIKVPAHLTDGLRIGQSLTAWRSLSAVDSNSAEMHVTILEIGQSSTGENSLYPVVVALPEQQIRTGEALEIGIPERNEPALIIPMSAVMRSADGLTVFQNINNRVTRVAVDVEQLQGEYAVIKPGTLAEGAQVVYAGITRLADGDLIEVLP